VNDITDEEIHKIVFATGILLGDRIAAVRALLERAASQARDGVNALLEKSRQSPSHNVACDC
jgi:hypothetical protein